MRVQSDHGRHDPVRHHRSVGVAQREHVQTPRLPMFGLSGGEHRGGERAPTIGPDTPHNASTYANLGCRCAVCRADEARKDARRRQRRVGMPLPEGVEHGTEHAYDNWMCRCDACRTATMEIRRRRRR